MIRFGPKRSHPLIIFNNFFSNFGLLVALLIFCFIKKDFSPLYDNLALPVIVLIGPIGRLFNYLFTQYTIDDEKLFIEKGLINKKKIELPLSSITSVDFTQSLIFQLAGVNMVNVENSASIRGNQTKIQFALKAPSALEAKAYLMGNRREESGQSPQEQMDNDKILSRRAASTGEILMLGLLQAKGLMIFQVFSVATVIITFGSQLFLDKKVDGDQYILDWFMKLHGLQVILIVFVALYTVGIIASIALSTIKYFGFCVTNREDSIFVEYGLLTRQTHTIMKNKISGVNYKQSFFMRLFHFGVLYAFVAGFSLEDDNKPKDAMLFPLIRDHELRQFLEQHIPETTAPKTYTKPGKQSIRYFFICPRFILSLLLLAGCLGYLFLQGRGNAPTIMMGEYLWILALILVLFAVCSVLLEYRHAGLHCNLQNVSMTYGGFTLNQVTLLTDKIESIKERATLTKKNKNMTNVLVSIIAAPQFASHRVRNLSLDDFRQLESQLKY